MDQALKHIDAFIAPSQFCKEKHSEVYPHLPILPLPHFVPSTPNEDQIEQSNSVSNDTPYFLFVGRLEKIKGLQTLIPVFKSYPKAKLYVAGSGKLKARLMQLANGCTNIEFLDHLSQQKLQSMYQNAIAVILPYQSYEILPLVMLEAFSARIPVIVRSGGAMTEVVQETRSGFVYQTDQELVCYMDKLLVDKTQRDELGRNAVTAYQEKFSPEVHLQQYFNLIEAMQEEKHKHQKGVDIDGKME